MSIAAITYGLWSRRRLVACAGLLAILVGCAVGYNIFSFPPQSRQYDVGTATARLLVDTPSSQIVAVDPAGLAFVTSRANLLASLMVNGPIKTAIAQRVGLEPQQIAGIAESDQSPITSPTPPARGYVLTTTVLDDTNLSNPSGNQLPIIDIATQGPNAGRAVALANAAVAGLQQYLASQATVEQIPVSRRIRVTSLGPAQGAESVRGPGNLVVLAIAIVTFVVGCAIILLIPRLKRDWRDASAREADDEFDHSLDLMPDGVDDFPDLRPDTEDLRPDVPELPYPAALRAVKGVRESGS
jgi:hypothetical protein